jgi:hypothetical protein
MVRILNNFGLIILQFRQSFANATTSLELSQLGLLHEQMREDHQAVWDLCLDRLQETLHALARTGVDCVPRHPRFPVGHITNLSCRGEIAEVEQLLREFPAEETKRIFEMTPQVAVALSVQKRRLNLVRALRNA